jgi:hypothetical protein
MKQTGKAVNWQSGMSTVLIWQPDHYCTVMTVFRVVLTAQWISYAFTKIKRASADPVFDNVRYCRPLKSLEFAFWSYAPRSLLDSITFTNAALGEARMCLFCAIRW